MTPARQDALSLAALILPGVLARAVECEKWVASTHKWNPDANESIRKAGLSYRRQLDEVANLIEPVLAVRDAQLAASAAPIFP